MYCSTCGARVADGRATCQSCGAAVAPRMSAPQGMQHQMHGMHQQPMVIPSVAGPGSAGTILEPVGMCPRCGFRGQSVGYFSRGGHVAGLVLLTVVTAGAFGFGGILYYLLRREHRVCPRCGEGWGKHGAFALVSGPSGVVSPRGLPQGDDMAAAGGGAKRFFSWALFAFAALFMMIGLGEMELGLMLTSLFSGGGGYLLHRSANLDREARREALLQRLQLPVLQLAGKRGGRLTVTDVATEFGWPMTRAEKVLNSLEDGMRVMSDITADGVIVYDFLEIRAAQLPGAESSRPKLSADGGQQALPA